MGLTFGDNMDSDLERLLEMGKMTDTVSVRPQSVIHELKIVAKTIEDKQLINEGEYPKQYGVFRHFIPLVSGSRVKHEFELLSEEWCHDEKNPCMLIQLRERFL